MKTEIKKILKILTSYCFKFFICETISVHSDSTGLLIIKKVCPFLKFFYYSPCVKFKYTCSETDLNVCHFIFKAIYGNTLRPRQFNLVLLTILKNKIYIVVNLASLSSQRIWHKYAKQVGRKFRLQVIYFYDPHNFFVLSIRSKYELIYIKWYLVRIYYLLHLFFEISILKWIA